MSSEKRIAASRANGALSRGPKTPEGKARSARNATRHGLLARVIVLEQEPKDGFLEVAQSYSSVFAPRNEVEADMVDEMVATSWRLRRTWAIENRYFDTAMANQDGPCATERLMTAWGGLVEEKRLDLLHRYETRLHMMYQRAFRNLVALRKSRAADLPVGPGATRPIPNEPRMSNVFNTRPRSEPETNLTRISAILDTTREGS